ncbi:MAG TPA: GDP-L-fucose synthase [Flavobacteriales bacterium]|nr:GDP-L-fucose synthase [Flavobacteriales bacterium]HIA12553.1 GDP-L-fucose synthase [Flavobacteriales bacterium]
MEKSDKIYIAGHRGMVGSAILRRLEKEGYTNLLLRTSDELDLRNQNQVQGFMEEERPTYVFLAAAQVGGIGANDKYRAEFFYNNLMIEVNVIHASYLANVKKLMFLGSSCIYPKMADQPLKEEYILTGVLESTNEAYAIAKIAGLKMCQYYRHQYKCNFISVMPTNLFGYNDNYDLEKAHVLPALLSKFHTAKIENKSSVVVWGTGAAKREFLHSDDLADAVLFLMQHYDDPGLINIGTGKDISIMELANLIKDIVGFKGEIEFDSTKPDGTPRKLLNVDKIGRMGWQSKIELRKGIIEVYSEVQNMKVLA